jgi:hypothetical protein
MISSFSGNKKGAMGALVGFTDGSERGSISGQSMSTSNRSTLKRAVVVMSVALGKLIHG